MVASPSEDEIKAVTRRPVTDVLVPARRGALKRRRFALYEGMGEQGVGLYNGCGIFFWLLANLNGCLSERSGSPLVMREESIARPADHGARAI